jgi:hypothetical protein
MNSGVSVAQLREDESSTASARVLSLPLLATLSAAKFIIHAALSGRYGYFRDELYFLDCGRHLSWGYVDHAPMIGLVARIALLLGGSLHVLRLIPALAGAGLVALTMLIAWRLGASRWGQAFAGLCVLFAPIFLALDSLFTMNCFEPLFWMGCAYVLVRIIQTGNSRLWIWFGVLAGLGLMNKHSTAFFGAAVAAAIVLTPLRRELGRPWIWIGGLIALAIFSPNLIWQVAYHFPTLEDLRNVRDSGKNVVLGPGAFLKQQIFMTHPVLLPVWLSGLWFFLVGRGTRYRALGWTYLALLGIFMALHGKDYYLAPAYPMLFAGGAVAIEQWLARSAMTRERIWPQAAIASVVVIAGAMFAPVVLPLLSPDNYVAYAQALHLMPPKTEVHHEGRLPQMFGDQFGWPELVAEVAQIYNSLPADQRARTAILTGNYGEAGAINLMGPKYGLPTAISGHQTYYFWGTNGFTGDQVITIQYGPHFLGQICSSFEQAGEHYNYWGMAEENHAYYLCHLKQPLAAMWDGQKHWN